jgi:peptidoglycan/LPS O-acetylase OafA/YrhL
MNQSLDFDLRAHTAARLPSLTGMRFVAAAVVVLHHSFFMYFFADPEVNTVLTRIGIGGAFSGVGFFFMLSGFVLAWSARDDGVLRFWRRRVVKIYPNHFVTALAGIGLALLFGMTLSVPQVVPNLFLVNTWVPDQVVLTAINQPSWSLCAELFFYLLFPWLFRLAKRIPDERLWWWAGAVVLAVLAVPFFARTVFPSYPEVPGLPASAWQWWFCYLFPPTRLLEFFLGILIARLVRAGRWVPVGMLPALLALLAGLVVQILLLPRVYGIVAPVVVPIALVIGAGATADLRGTASPFRGPVLRRLGEISFALYMVHFLVLQFGKQLLGAGRTWSSPAAVGVIAMFFVVCLAAAWLLYTVVEKPAMRRWGGQRR